MFRKVINLFGAEKIQDKIFSEFKRALEINRDKFIENLELPKYFGKGLPERVVEILVAKLSYQPNLKVLDVGHANAMRCHLKMLSTLQTPKNLYGIDIAKPKKKVQSYYNQSHIGDISKTFFPDESFDLIWCISALEHFGMDNSGYTDHFQKDEKKDIEATSEMFRILKKNGQIIITVPFGKYENHGWFKNYHQESLFALTKELENTAMVDRFYFRHLNQDGWIKTTSEELQYTGYFDQGNLGAAGLAILRIIKK